MDGEQPAGPPLPQDPRPVPAPPVPRPPWDATEDRNPVRQTADVGAETAPEAGLPHGVAELPADEADPAEIPVPPDTGDAGVDEAVQLVAAAVRGTLDEQVQAYESAHRTLQDRLADVES